MSDAELAAFFFLQLACILAACRVVGWLASYAGQPQVVAEMVTGFVLGPSVFGALLPDLQRALFPPETLRPIYVCSQVGLALYMFTVGLEFETSLVTRNARQAAAISIAGVAVPFALGGLLAMAMLANGGYFAGAITPGQAVLFVGAAMSITAFPMLARIIYERGIAGTPLGTLALAAGATDDAAAWVMLAVVIGSFSGNVAQAGWPILGGLGYALFLFGPLQPVLRRLAGVATARAVVEPWLFSTMLALLAVGAWFTDSVGIYAVFGAFLLGAAIPRGLLTRELQARIEPLTTALLLPLFFVYSGLNTQLGLLSGPSLWTMALLVVFAACIGKGAACWLAARASGASARDALGVATLMNARGLMELILLNIGLQRGLITPTLYTMLALMAIGTTLMAYPLFGLVYRRPMGGAHPAIVPADA